MVSFRESIKDDFKNIVDDLETVRYFSRQTGQLVRVCEHAKRSHKQDANEQLPSLGFAVTSPVSFQIAAADLEGQQVYLGDWLLDADGARYVVARAFKSQMTNRWRLRCVSLQEVFDGLVTITTRAGDSPTGAPSARQIPWRIDIPARVWPVGQGEADLYGDDLRATWRCALFADGTQVPLPIPQGAGLINQLNGDQFEIVNVRDLDQLAGFAILDLVPQPKERA